MKLTVILDPEADKDIEDEFTYLADRNIDIALRFLGAIDAALDALAEMPGMGSQRRFKSTKLTGIRMWSIKDFPNYLIFYRATEENVQVLRIIHGARDVEKILLDSGA